VRSGLVFCGKFLKNKNWNLNIRNRLNIFFYKIAKKSKNSNKQNKNDHFVFLKKQIFKIYNKNLFS